MRVEKTQSWKRLLHSPGEEHKVVIHLILSTEEMKKYNEGKLSLLTTSTTIGEPKHE